MPIGFLCGAIFLIFARPKPLTLAIGAVVSILGLLLRAWASGHIRKNHELATSGPYAFTRNPLYLGSFFLGLGFTIGAGWWPLWILFVAVFLGIYFPVMRVESRTLAGLFGEKFQRYSESVPLFFPGPTSYRDPDNRNTFDKRLYMRYREYRAALGMVAAWGVLVFKAYYWK